MLKTRDLIHAKLKAHLSDGDPIHPFTAKELCLYEIIDDIKRAIHRPVERLKTHEEMRLDSIMGA